MPFDIQRLPKGLLQLLSIYSGGRTPRTMGDQVYGTLDMLRHYAPVECIQQVTAATGAVGQSDLVFVPATETWVLFGMGFQQFSDTDNQTICMAGFARTFTPANSFPVYRFETIADNGDRVDYGIMLPFPIVLPPGSVLTTMIQRPISTNAIVSRHLVARLG